MPSETGHAATTAPTSCQAERPSATRSLDVSSANLPWEWVLEKALELKEFSPSCLKLLMDYIPHIEEPRCHNLIQKVALRYLEDMVISRKVDASAIPLITTIIRPSKRCSSNKSFVVKDMSMEDLTLRVQTEAILVNLRDLSVDETNRWKQFYDALSFIFPEEICEPKVVERRKEFLLLMENKGEREALAQEALKKFPLDNLLQDLLKLISESQKSGQMLFVDKLAEDVFNGLYSPSLRSVPDQGHPSKVHVTRPVGQNIPEASLEDDLICEERNMPSVVLKQSSLQDNRDQVNNVDDNGQENSVLRTNSVNQRELSTIDKPLSSSNHEAEQIAGAMERSTEKHNAPFLEGRKKKRVKNSQVGDVETRLQGTVYMSSSPLPVGETAMPSEFLANSTENVSPIIGAESSEHNRNCCYMCKNEGSTVSCHSCSITIHHDCLKKLGIIHGADEKIWHCPVCWERITNEALEKAQQEAEVARTRLASFLGAQGSSKDGCHQGDQYCERRDQIATREQQPRPVKPNENTRLGASPCHSVDESLILNKKMQQANTAGMQVRTEAEPHIATTQGAKIDTGHVIEQIAKETQHVTNTSSSVAHKNEENSSRGAPFVSRPSSGLVCAGDCCSKEIVSQPPPKVGGPMDQFALLKEPSSVDAHTFLNCTKRYMLDRRQEVSNLCTAELSDQHNKKTIETAFVRASEGPANGQGISHLSPAVEDDIGNAVELEKHRQKADSFCEIEMISPTRKRNTGPIGEAIDLGNNSFGGDYSFKYRNRSKIPGLRRKGLPWTKDEEDTLKEGVRRYSQDGGTFGFQWKYILEFGYGKFDVSRTTVDLKDKWRNMVKGRSRSSGSESSG